MSELRDFLINKDVGVSSTGEELHIANSLLETIIAVVDASDIVVPTFSATEVAAVGFATVGGVALAFAGPIVGMTGVFMALGAGYEEAREEIQNEAAASGFAQGFVAGLLKMSAQSVSFLFGEHGVIHRNAADPEADVLEMHARNRGLVAGYSMAKLVPEDDKKAYIFEIREFTGDVPVGNWTDLDKKNYVITYAAKLRLNFMQ